jgi:hypothetical protein
VPGGFQPTPSPPEVLVARPILSRVALALVMALILAARVAFRLSYELAKRSDLVVDARLEIVYPGYPEEDLEGYDPEVAAYLAKEIRDDG